VISGCPGEGGRVPGLENDVEGSQDASGADMPDALGCILTSSITRSRDLKPAGLQQKLLPSFLLQVHNLLNAFSFSFIRPSQFLLRKTLSESPVIERLYE
jgi:hypothetical protein